MNTRTRTGVEIIAAAGSIGVLGNLLLRQTPWGLNAFLFVLAFTAAMVALTVRHRRDLLTTRSLALQAAMVFFGAMFLLRDSIELRIYDTFAIIVIMGVLVLPNFGINQRIAGAFHYAAGFMTAGVSSLIAPFVLLGADIEWKSMPGNRLSKSMFSVLRGLAVALPLVLIFGALFMAADAAYENFANRAINFDLETVISHVMLTSLFAWLTAGYFRGTLIDFAYARNAATVSPIPKADQTQPENAAEAHGTGTSFVDKFTAEPAEDTSLPNNATVLEHINTENDAAADVQPASEVSSEESAKSAESKKRDWQNWDNTKFPQVFTLGTVETVIILGLLDLLFLSFVLFQLPYLFGGMELVQNTPDLKLSEFARRGFGELVAVSAMVLPILLVSHWLLRRDDGRNERVFRILAGVQIILLFVIMTSAMQRLVLLTGDLGYGWTAVRFYPMVLIIWLAAVFVWFAATVLRGSRQNFAWGALWAAIAILGTVNLMNPDDFIARSNLRLMQQGRDYDAYYNAQLSDDAVPALIESLPLMSVDDQCRTKAALTGRFIEAKEEGDLRSWNYGRWRAYEIMFDNTRLRQRDGCSSAESWNAETGIDEQL